MFGGSRSKDKVFYDAFRAQANVALDAATKFATLLDDLADAKRHATAIHEDKQRGSEIFRQTLRELHSTWITPLDRHQIHELIASIDGVLSLVDSTAGRVVLFGIRDVRSEAQELARSLTEACQRVATTFEFLPKLSKNTAPDVIRLASEIHEIDGRSEEIYQRALSTLFDGSTEPLQVMKWREVFDNLEDATDGCRAVAHLFEAIVLENA